MKHIGFITLFIFTCIHSGWAQKDSPPKDTYSHGVYQSVYSDPHDTDMDERIKSRTNKKAKYKDLIGESLTYDFGDFGFEVVFRSDSLIYWKNLGNQYEETDISKTLLLDPYTVLTAWVELDGSFVSLYSNFNKKTASFFIRNKEGQYEGYSGIINLKKY